AALRYARDALAIDAEQPAFHCLFRARVALAALQVGDAASALTEATTAMRLMDTHGRPEEGEMVVRVAYARALHANGRTADARVAIDDAEQRILAAAGAIGDDDLRSSFLEAVPEHAAILSLAREWR